MATMPSQASDGLVVSRLRRLSIPYRRARSSRTSWNSCSTATIRGPRNWADGCGIHTAPSISTVGITGSASNTGSVTVPVPSAIGVTILSADHNPVARDMAIPCRPSSRHSATEAGYRIGMCRSTSAASDDDGIVEDLAAGSSPTNASAPPPALDPANTPWRRASVARSRPGALPYQIPTTPSYLASGRVATNCEPITAVAPSSSFTAGWCTIGRSPTSRSARANSRSKPPAVNRDIPTRTPPC